MAVDEVAAEQITAEEITGEEIAVEETSAEEILAEKELADSVNLDADSASPDVELQEWPEAEKLASPIWPLAVAEDQPQDAHPDSLELQAEQAAGPSAEPEAPEAQDSLEDDALASPASPFALADDLEPEADLDSLELKAEQPKGPPSEAPESLEDEEFASLIGPITAAEAGHIDHEEDPSDAIVEEQILSDARDAAASLRESFHSQRETVVSPGAGAGADPPDLDPPAAEARTPIAEEPAEPSSAVFSREEVLSAKRCKRDLWDRCPHRRTPWTPPSKPAGRHPIPRPTTAPGRVPPNPMRRW